MLLLYTIYTPHIHFIVHVIPFFESKLESAGYSARWRELVIVGDRPHLASRPVVLTLLQHRRRGAVPSTLRAVHTVTRVPPVRVRRRFRRAQVSRNMAMVIERRGGLAVG